MIPDQPFPFCADADGEDDAPQEGETYISSWDNLLYAMTNGEMGTPPPKTPQHYQPPRTRETTPPDAEEENKGQHD